MLDVKESKQKRGCKKTSAHQLGDKTSRDFEEKFPDKNYWTV